MDEEKTTQRDGQQEPPRDNVREKSFWQRVKDNRLILTVVIAIIAFVLFIIAFSDKFSAFINNVMEILSPIIIGVIIAYLCNPILNVYEYRIFRKMKNQGTRRGISIALTLLTALGIVVAVGFLIIPELIDSISELIANYETYLNELFAFINNVINSVVGAFGNNGSGMADGVKEYINMDMLRDVLGSTEDLLRTLLNVLTEADMSDSIVGGTFYALIALFNAVKNVLLGIFIAFYILISREKRTAQIRKFRRAVFTKKTNLKINEITRLTSRCFGGYLYGMLVDAIIVGILSFVIFSIFEISPYNILIASIIAMTNVIPVFGPFIGGIPAFFIVLISNPSKALLFIILILIIQQIDGNIIYPKITGDNTGVSSLCIIISIIIAGSLWGIFGMIIGVPLFSVFVELIKRIIESKLLERGESTDTVDYYPSNAINDAEREVYYEHSGIRYRYEHSKLKVHVDKLRSKFFKATSVAGDADESEISEDTESESVSAADIEAENIPSDATAEEKASEDEKTEE